MTTPETSRYPVKIAHHQLRQPPDLSALTDISPDLTFTVRGDVTPAEFSELCAGDIRLYLSLPTENDEEHGGWTIHIGPEEVSVFENSRSPQALCMSAWLRVYHPDYPCDRESLQKLAHDWDDLSLPVLYFLMQLYCWYTDLSAAPDAWALEQMAENGVAYTDFADVPA